MNQKSLAEKWEDEIAILQSKILLQKAFPDLEEVGIGHGITRLCSNEICNKGLTIHTHINASCGCCADAVMMVSPYIEYSGIRVYGKIGRIGFGEKNEFGYGVIAWEGWEDRIRSAGYPETVIEQVREYLAENPMGYFEEDEDEDDDAISEE